MSKCKMCGVDILDKTDCCPLCNHVLESDGIEREYAVFSMTDCFFTILQDFCVKNMLFFDFLLEFFFLYIILFRNFFLPAAGKKK